MEKVNRKQIGGDHYEKLSVQPVELYNLFKLDAFQGPILKYLSRHKNKNGLQDLIKAIDYCNLAINYNHKPLVEWDNIPLYYVRTIFDYCYEINKLNNNPGSSSYLKDSIILLICGDWVKCKNNIKLYIYSEYDIDVDKV